MSKKTMSLRLATLVFCAVHLALGAPPGFPSSGNGLWYDSVGTFWARHYLPLGNGYLAAMTPGGITQDITFLNIESLWSGGPFQDPVCLYQHGYCNMLFSLTDKPI